MIKHAPLAALAVTTCLCPSAFAQTGTSPASSDARIEDQERRIRELESALGDLRERVPAPDPSGFETTYDKGFVIRSKDGPFSLRINGRIQFRAASFAPSESTYENLGTDASGTPIDVERRNDFEIERARLSFGGTFLDPDLHFYINLDGDTDDNHEVIFHDFWFNYEFDEAFDLYVGKAFVPGSREWLAGSTSTHLIDRSMATTFFRPDRSVGVWAIGEPIEDFHYRVMIGNGFQTSDLDNAEINDEPMVSGSVWWEPLGDFGSGYADLKRREDAVLRLGTSYTFAGEDGQTPSGSPLPESNFLRLDDGTRLTDLGVDHFDVSLLALDAAFKHRGWSLHGEGYYRWVDNISPTGAAPAGFPDDESDAYGGYVGAGYMLMREKLDIEIRSSTVQGDLKDSWEYAAGMNWYLDGTHGNKLSFDVTHLDGSPVSNSGPDFRVGDDGWLVRLQLQLSF
jgi:hypothetical protein